MKPALVALLLLAALAGGCAASLTEESSARREPAKREATRQDSVPTTARVVCGEDGTKDGAKALTPRVEAQRDGVHYALENRYGEAAGYAAETSEGGAGGDMPKGGVRQVGDFSPGEARIGCDEPPPDDLKLDYATVKVLKGDSGYRPVDLECPGGMAVGGGPQYAAGVKGEKGEPVELARRVFSDELGQGDVVETAGYPESPGRRAVRERRVVATVAFTGDGGGWLQDHYYACEGF